MRDDDYAEMMEAERLAGVEDDHARAMADAERRLAEYDQQAGGGCDHWSRTDWIDETTCGCGVSVV